MDAARLSSSFPSRRAAAAASEALSRVAGGSGDGHSRLAVAACSINQTATQATANPDGLDAGRIGAVASPQSAHSLPIAYPATIVRVGFGRDFPLYQIVRHKKGANAMRFHLRSIAAIAVSAGVVLFLTACKIPAAELDPASAIRGSLGVSLDDLSLTDYFGRVAFLLGGGFALLWGAIAG